MARTTRRQAEMAAERLVRACGGQMSKGWTRGEDGQLRADVGAFVLDYAACYGGYQLQQHVTDGGGVSTPFGDRRMSAREFWDACYFACRALDVYRLIDGGA